VVVVEQRPEDVRKLEDFAGTDAAPAGVLGIGSFRYRLQPLRRGETLALVVPAGDCVAVLEVPRRDPAAVDVDVHPRVVSGVALPDAGDATVHHEVQDQL
jgi:hypothetical protein